MEESSDDKVNTPDTTSGNGTIDPAADRVGESSVDQLIANSLLRQKRLERVVVGIAVSFISMIFFLAFYLDTPVAASAERVIGYIAGGISEGGGSGPKNVVSDCKNPKNEKTPYCQERKSRTDSTWKSIQRFGDVPNAFSLHER